MEKKINLMILGGSGFIGFNLVKFFSKKSKFKVYATYHSNRKIIRKGDGIIWKKIDLRNPSSYKNLFKNIDIVLQFAATTSGSKDIINKPYLHVTDNAIMNSYILKEINNSSVKQFVFPSCTVMYHSSKIPLKETDFNPSFKINDKYFGVANTKIYIEKLCEFYSTINSLKKFTVVRHSNLYGPYDKFDLEKSHMFGANINKVINSINEVTIWGEGKEKRDLLYVLDFCHFVEAAINKQTKKFEIYNVGYGKDFSVKNIVKKIIKFSNKKIKIKFDLTKPNIPTYLSLNCSKAKKELGWYPKTSMDLGIKKTIAWYYANEFKK